MRHKPMVAAALSALALLVTTPAIADTPGEAAKGPQQLRALDIMLMVTSLRCRAGADDFEADFHRFEANHMVELNRAAQTLSGQLAQDGGPGTAHRAGRGEDAMDRISVAIANQYGAGHPWLGCHELKAVTSELADAPGEAPLLEAAPVLLGGDGPRVAYARH